MRTRRGHYNLGQDRRLRQSGRPPRGAGGRRLGPERGRLVIQWLAWAAALGGAGAWLVTRSAPEARLTVAIGLAVAALVCGLLARRAPRVAIALAGAATLVGTVAYGPGRWGEPWPWLALATGAVAAAVCVSIASTRAPSATAWVAGGLAFGGLVATALVIAPPGTWSDVVLTDDYGIVHYNTMADLDAFAAGGAFGWEARVEGGRPGVLNLRTLAPLVAPLAWLDRTVALQLVYLLVFLAFPWLVGWLARRVTGEPIALAWGVAVGSALAYTTTANLYRFGMINAFAAIDLLLVQWIALEGWVRGRRGAAIALGFAVGLAAWIHVAQLVMGLVALAIGGVVHLCAGRRPRVGAAVGAVVLAVGVAWPFIAAVWRERASIATEYLMAISPVIVALRDAGPRGAIELVTRDVLWSFPSYLRVGAVMLPLVGWVVGARRGAAGLGIAMAAGVALALVAWMPDVAYSILRAHFLLVALAAVVGAVAVACAPATWRGAAAAAAFVAALALPGLDWPVERYHATDLRASEPELVDAVVGLPGARVLYENTAGQSPLADLNAPWTPWPGDEVQRAGPLALASGRELFAHAGWDPYPYHRLRDAFIVNGAWRGVSLPEADAAAFDAVLARYGVGGVAVWSAPARAFFDARPDRFRPVGHVPARTAPVRVAPFALYTVVDADPRRLRLATGTAALDAVDPFTARFAVRGARAGETLTWVTRYHADWTATVDGAAVPVVDGDGLVRVVAPRDGDFALEFRFPKRHADLWIGAGLALVGLVAIALAGRAV